jgi:hypothetical protein
LRSPFYGTVCSSAPISPPPHALPQFKNFLKLIFAD